MVLCVDLDLSVIADWSTQVFLDVSAGRPVVSIFLKEHPSYHMQIPDSYCHQFALSKAFYAASTKKVR